MILNGFKSIIIVFFLFTTAGYSFGSGDINGSGLLGRVTSDGEGASFVTVYLKGTSVGTSTDAEGRFALPDLPPGTHVVRVQGIGFRSQEIELEISNSQVIELEFELEKDIHLMEQVVVSGSRIGILQHLPGSARKIDNREIMAISPLSGNELLRTVTGIHVVEEEGAGLRVNIGVRGLDPDKSRNVLILEDGIPVALGPYGEPEMYYTPSIDRMRGVEILKGSGSILFGPQTVGGVINYITADPPAESSGSVSFTGGKGGYYTGQAVYGNSFGNAGFNINYLRRQAENIGPTEFVLNDISSKIRFSASPRSGVSLKIGIYDEKSNSTYVGLTQYMYNSGSMDYIRLAPDDQLSVRRYSVGLSHDLQINDDLRFNTTFFAYTTSRNWKRQDFSTNPSASNQTGVFWGDPGVTGGAIFMQNSTGNRNRQFEVAGIEPRMKYRYTLFEKQNILDAGARFLFERAYEQRINGSSALAVSGNLRDDEIRTGRAFSSWAQNKILVNDRFSFTAGVRTEMLKYERNIIRSRFADININNSTLLFEIIPGAGLNYNFSEGSGIFAGIHRGFAPPRIKDAISSDGTDMELDAEKSWNLEIGSRARLSGLLGMEVTFFLMDFSNQVIPVSESSGGLGAGYINGGRTTHRGIEAELNLFLSDLLQIPGQLLLNLNTTLSSSVFSGDRFVAKRISVEDGIDDKVFVNIKGNRTPYAPGRISSGYLHYDSPGGFGLRLSAHFTGWQYTDVLNTDNVTEWLDLMQSDPGYVYMQASADGRIGKLPQFSVVNLSSWYELRSGVKITLSVKNLLDERYISTRRPQGIRVGLPRMLNAGLTYGF